MLRTVRSREAGIATIVERHIDVGGISLFARELGEGEPILLLHGLPTTSALWLHQLPLLAGYGRAIAPDLPGYGRSDKPADAPYTVAWYAAFVAKLVDRLDAERVSILCHDVGGFAALAFAAEHPERIRRLVVFNTSIYPDFRPPGRLRLLRHPLLSWSLTAMPPPRLVLRSLIAGGFADRSALTRELLDEFHAPLRDRVAREAQLRFSRSVDSDETRERLRGWAARLGGIDAPTLILWGRLDRWIAIERHGRRLAADLPNSRLVALEARHFVPLDAAAAVNEHLDGFFASGSLGR